MAKATVQAALGPVVLRRLRNSENGFTKEQETFAKIIELVCILSIVVTAPIGAILISITGPRLLTKTKPMQNVEGRVPLLDGIEQFYKQKTAAVCSYKSCSSSNLNTYTFQSSVQ